MRHILDAHPILKMPSPRLRDDGNADSFSDILGVEGWDPLAETWPIVSVGGESADRVTEKRLKYMCTF